MGTYRLLDPSCTLTIWEVSISSRVSPIRPRSALLVRRETAFPGGCRGVTAPMDVLARNDGERRVRKLARPEERDDVPCVRLVCVWLTNSLRQRGDAKRGAFEVSACIRESKMTKMTRLHRC